MRLLSERRRKQAKIFFDEYLCLASIDAKTFFKNEERKPIDSPACGLLGQHIFRKDGFDYSECPKCIAL